METETHRRLVEEYVTARSKYEQLDAARKEANELYRDAVGKLAEFMTANALKSLKYEDLGAVTLKEPIVRPNVLKENEDKLFAYVREIGRGEVIKENIHHLTLGALIRDVLAEGKELPEFVGYYLEPSLMFKAALRKAA